MADVAACMQEPCARLSPLIPDDLDVFPNHVAGRRSFLATLISLNLFKKPIFPLLHLLTLNLPTNQKIDGKHNTAVPSREGYVSQAVESCSNIRQLSNEPGTIALFTESSRARLAKIDTGDDSAWNQIQSADPNSRGCANWPV
jgi:hypothetical protein